MSKGYERGSKKVIQTAKNGSALVREIAERVPQHKNAEPSSFMASS